MKPFERWFINQGAYVLVDGQYGSTGKGLLAGLIAQSTNAEAITHVTTNAGPNSGHTAFYDGEKIVTQQVPVASVILRKMGLTTTTLLNAGAIIDEKILHNEVAAWLDYRKVLIHPRAALIRPENVEADKQVVKQIAGTGKGIGPAIMGKISRLSMGNIAYGLYRPMLPEGEPQRSWDSFWDWTKDVVFVETAQGFSLGLNSTFYPNVTSRECTVQQALADARIPAQMLRKVVACFRTYPIRVGNTESSSGEGYGDQEETSWEELGLEPEITTVTKRVRRVFTWSRVQFREAVAVNRPDVIFLNFMNYIKGGPTQERLFIINVLADYFRVMRRYPEQVLLGYGPLASDISVWDNNQTPTLLPA